MGIFIENQKVRYKTLIKIRIIKYRDKNGAEESAINNEEAGITLQQKKGEIDMLEMNGYIYLTESEKEEMAKKRALRHAKQEKRKNRFNWEQLLVDLIPVTILTLIGSSIVFYLGMVMK